MDTGRTGQDGRKMESNLTLTGEAAVLKVDQKSLVPEERCTQEGPGNVRNPEGVFRDVVVRERYR